MRLNGVFTMISVESRESNGKFYNNINLEADDGKLLRIGVNEDVVKNLRKYEKHSGVFEVGTYNNQMFMRLVKAEPLISK